MQSATQEQINASPIAKQLWCIQFPDKEGNGLGVIEMDKSFLVATEGNEKKPLKNICVYDSDYQPETDEQWNDFTMNTFIDTNITTTAPNIFLYLEAIFENFDEKVAAYHLSVYKASVDFINSDKKTQAVHPSIKRLDSTFTWTSDEEGYLINHVGRKFMRFDNPQMAKFVALACSQYYSLNFSVMQDQLKQLGLGTGFIFGGSKGLGFISEQTKELSKSAYLELKQMVQDMNWDLHAQVLNLNSTLEQDYL